MKHRIAKSKIVRLAICLAVVLCYAESRSATIAAGAGTLSLTNTASAGLLKLGAGTLNVTASSYTGATNITSGNIIVGGTATLNSGSMLTGSANAVANLTINSGGSAGTINVSSGTLSFNVVHPSSGSGTLQVANGVIIPSNLLPSTYYISQASKPAGYQLTLGHYLPAAIYSPPVTSLSAQLSLSQNTAPVFGPRPFIPSSNPPTISTVPEPTTLGLAALGLGTWAAGRVLRRARKRNFAAR